ncbi:MAG: hypothetical protein KME13_00395 [Myxacorys californica WJT36-NPBG1]|nr:hypothetical protein [Myxacorys californica WJT36-NPBG1]
MSTRTGLQEMISMTKRRLALPIARGLLITNFCDDRDKTEQRILEA